MVKTILVVDDEKKILSMFGKVLCAEGFNVLKAQDAEKAHELLMGHPVDLVLLDINMPEVDGSVLYDMIEVFFKHTKVIVASVYPIEDQQSLIAGAVDYFDKSDRLKVLIEKVRSALFETEEPKTLSITAA